MNERDQQSPLGDHTPGLGLPLDTALYRIAEQVQRLARAQGQVQTLLGAVLAISRDLDQQSILQRIVATAMDLVDARYGALGVLSDDRTRVTEFIALGLTDQERADLAGSEIPQGRGLLGLMIHETEPLRLDDLTRHPDSIGFPSGHPPMRSLLGVAITVRGQIYGNLYLSERRDGQPFDTQDEAVAVSLAGAAGIAIENSRLYEQVRLSALAYGEQLQSFTRTLQNVTTAKDLVVFMREAMHLLELRHGFSMVFNYDVSAGKQSFLIETSETPADDWINKHRTAITLAHQQRLTLMVAHPGGPLGLNDSSFLIPFEIGESGQSDAGDPINRVLGGFAFDMQSKSASEEARKEFLSDASLFIENWCVAYGTLCLKERLQHEQLLRDKARNERMESIATMVTGVAHELNTPLGTARTAGCMVAESLAVLTSSFPEMSDNFPIAADVRESVQLMNRNLDRAHLLIQSFRKLSTSQMFDNRMTVDLRETISDCIAAMAPDLEKAGIVATIHSSERQNWQWDGYPGHLSQVLVSLIRNVLQYAYGDGLGGKIDIFLGWQESDFSITFADYGCGISPEILPRVFEAFVTSRKGGEGIGLGLSIARNIVHNLLGGKISCESPVDVGTRFVIELPLASPDNDYDAYSDL
ncbi:ATP-binding protein [Streptomyces sp. NPDC002659]|uniref:sensor histidine kinase n=1 Tax=Streptomyces sp. NPDC002659 TaxID=3364656 RepID=UPI0036818757